MKHLTNSFYWHPLHDIFFDDIKWQEANRIGGHAVQHEVQNNTLITRTDIKQYKNQHKNDN